jgi:hypothetical protein
VTAKSNPAARIVPERETQSGFAATENATLPEPVPLPDIMVSQGDAVTTEADQAHPLLVFIRNSPEPPLPLALVVE